VVGVVVLVVVVVGVVVDGVALVVVVVTDVVVETGWQVSSMNSDKIALRSLKSATVKTVLCSPGGDAIPRSSSSLMSLPIPRASHTYIPMHGHRTLLSVLAVGTRKLR